MMDGSWDRERFVSGGLGNVGMQTTAEAVKLSLKARRQF